jgi:ammonium transporter Rh
MIPYGAVLGKTSPTQLILMGLLETILYWINAHLVFGVIAAHDVGGGMVIHSFGAYFGLACTYFFTSKNTKDCPDESAIYSSDIFSLTGTLLLWLLWPSFNAAVAGGVEPEMYAIAHTFVSLCACVLGTAVTSRLLCKGKLDTVHMQNATLAGGVMMGVIGDLPIGIYTAGAAGFCAGILSTMGYALVTPMLSDMGIQDICGVNNLHGMPGIAASLLAAVVVEVLPEEQVGHTSAGVQLKALGCTLGIAIGGGAVVGKMMQLMQNCTVKLKMPHNFNDQAFWNTPDDYGSLPKQD